MLYEGIEVNTQQQAEPKTIGSPVGGLNGRDAKSDMAETDAYQMDNVWPGTTSCKVRPGCEIHQDPVGAPVSSLEVYASAAGNALLAFAKPNIYEATIKDTVTSLKADLNSDEIVASMMSTAADNAQWLIITTGADTPMSYNGTAIADLALTGNIDPLININYVANYKLRLYFATEGRLGFYYLPPGQIQGALEWFDLGQVSIGGGYLQAIGTYSMDAGDGPDDYIVFVTSRGECLMFNGLDPGDATAWDIVGRFRAAEPIGRKCISYYAGDLLILTNEGVQQFSQIKQLGDTRYEAVNLASKMGDILTDMNIHRETYGWCMCLWPASGRLFVNAPQTASRTGAYSTFAMNTTTNAWARSISDEWNPQCMVKMGQDVYFGRFDGSIRKIGGTYDNLKAIKFTVKQAYNYMNTPAHKHFKWAQFLVRSEAPVILASRLSVDYQETIPTAAPNPIGSGGGAEWDLAFWDEDNWGYGPFTQRWIAPYGNYGVAASHWLTGDIAGASLEWFSTEHVFEKAQGLL
jgi:hypothetical protein